MCKGSSVRRAKRQLMVNKHKALVNKQNPMVKIRIYKQMDDKHNLTRDKHKPMADTNKPMVNTHKPMVNKRKPMVDKHSLFDKQKHTSTFYTRSCLRNCL